MNIAVARNVGLGLLLGLAMLASSAGSAAASDPMLAGMTEAKMAFDITAAEPPRLLSILNVIEETRDGLVRQGITPRIILAFRGPAVAKVAAKIRELRGATGIERVEVCSIAMRLTKTPKEQLVPDVTVVENGWYTLVGAQAKGYAYIAP